MSAKSLDALKPLQTLVHFLQVGSAADIPQNIQPLPEQRRSACIVGQ